MALPRILIAEPEGFSAAALARLKQAGEVTLDPVPKGELAALLPAYDAIWVRLGHRIGASDVERRGRCRVIACPVTGLDHIDVAACERAGIRVVALKGETEFLKDVRATAELTVALALAVMRQIPAAAESVKVGHWNRDLFRGHELYKKTAGIVGVGRLGAIVAGYLQALGMKVSGYDVRDFSATGVEAAQSLDALLATSDLVSLHVSYGEATHGLIGASAFARMKPGSYFLNTSRGSVVDEAALLHALRSGRLAGAAVDVLAQEPDIGLENPVVQYARAHDNLLVVPHIGGNTYESFEKTELFIANKLIGALSA